MYYGYKDERYIPGPKNAYELDNVNYHCTRSSDRRMLRMLRDTERGCPAQGSKDINARRSTKENYVI